MSQQAPLNPALFELEVDGTYFTEVKLFDFYAAFAMCGILGAQPSANNIGDLTDSVCEAAGRFANKMLEKRQQFLK